MTKQMQQVEILLAEDSDHDAEMTLHALKKIGIINEIVRVCDGQQALDYLFRQAEFAERDDTLPKFIMLDLKMPKVDGIEVLKQLKANPVTRLIPVVMLTSSAEEQDIARSYELGVSSYIVKPVEFEKFVAEVSRLGFYWAIMNLVPEHIQR